MIYDKIFVCWGIIAVFAAAGFSQVAAVQTTHSDESQWQQVSTGRLQLSLNGAWHIAREQDNAPVQVTVPGISQKGQGQRLSRNFVLPDSLKNKAIFLHVMGINYQCRISVNDSPIASHAGGYTAFDFELKPEVLHFDAENTLTIEIDDELTPRTTLPFKHRPFGWRHLGGILRDIYLEAKPSVAIGDVYIRQQFQNAYKDVSLAIDVDFHAYSEIEDTLIHAKKFEVYCEVYERNETAPVAFSKKHTLVLNELAETTDSLKIELKNVKKWSTQRPYLYTLIIHLSANDRIIDTITLSLGLREVSIENSSFVLNGEPFFVKGVTWMDVFSGLSSEQLEIRLDAMMGRIKSLGANTLRVIGHPPHRRLVERCSREGIFLLEEIPLNCVNSTQLRSEQVAKIALQQLEEMISRDRQQPS
ncbi:MAG: glycoside hydrolase family 2 protein, partial [bacterium]